MSRSTQRIRVCLCSMVLAAATTVGSVALPAPASASPGVDRAMPTYADQVVRRGFVTVLGRHVDRKALDAWYPKVVQHDAVWFARALMTGPEYDRSLGRLGVDAFVAAVYENSGRTLTEADIQWWHVALTSHAAIRSTVVVWLIEHAFSYPLTRPAAVVGCAAFRDASPVRPLCARGATGDQKGVSILVVPGTNIYLNKAWWSDVYEFVKAGRAAGFDLQGEEARRLPTWMLSPGSWRSWQDQQWLYTHGYPANPPGRSMHEWGLAIDFDCNGKRINDVRACWDWARANGGRFHILNHFSVDDPHDAEAGHFSPNAH